MEGPLDEEPKLDFGNIKSHVSDYLKNRLEYYKLSVIEYSAKVAQYIVFVMVISVMVLLFWVFANVTLALIIGAMAGSITMGFLIIALFNLLLALFILVTRKALILKPVSNWMVKILVKSLEADENN